MTFTDCCCPVYELWFSNISTWNVSCAPTWISRFLLHLFFYHFNLYLSSLYCRLLVVLTNHWRQYIGNKLIGGINWKLPYHQLRILQPTSGDIEETVTMVILPLMILKLWTGHAHKINQWHTILFFFFMVKHGIKWKMTKHHLVETVWKSNRNMTEKATSIPLTHKYNFLA
jgi:hypothetical protein